MSPAQVDSSSIRLLLRALDTLEADERTAVLECLLGRALASIEIPDFAPMLTSAESRSMQLAFPARTGAAPPAVDQRMFPVRLPERDHTRLKAWCDIHGFPMAVVVRGLIERFLDQQEQAAGDHAGGP
ncbi:MAG TPA: hypothetical protein VG165_09085 [Solirubrobacteraceae bacterium]|nr:hypothetical protein [Solirubrobacteraceae bacterium]